MISEKPWKPDEVLRLGSGLFLSIFCGMLAMQFLLPRGELQGSDKFIALVIGTISLHLVALLLIHVFLRRHIISWSEAFGFSSDAIGRTLALALLAWLVAVPAASGLSYVVSKLMQTVDVAPVEQVTVQTLKAPLVPFLHKVYIGIAAIVIAPIVEELLFRGILYPAIKQQGFPKLALWGTSLLFAMIHFNTLTFVPLTFLAVALTLLYEMTDNLLAPILTHSLFNATNFFLLVALQP